MHRNEFTPSPLASVECPKAGDRWVPVFVRDLRHSPETVWAALTEQTQLSEWSPFLADRDLGSAGPATLTMVDGDTSQDMPARVQRAERPRLLEYTWGPDVLRWELVATASGTRLTLRHTTGDHDSMPQAAAGWHLCLDVAEHLLDGAPVGPIRGSAAMDFGWADLRDEYARTLEIEPRGE
jgi:uncharacterized protein YndB with AHSA1/START domain